MDLTPVLQRLGAGLLLLDGAEGLGDAEFAEIGGWIRSAPSLRVLVTSQRPLGLPEETTVAVRPLSVEPPATVLDSAAWAVVTDAAPTDAVSTASAEDAHGLLTALEGLPLSLVLAAGRLEVLAWRELLARRREPLAVLSDPDRTGPHASLEAALMASFALLSPALQDALGQAAVFAGTFDLTAAEAVLDADGTAVDLLQQLLRRNLVERRGEGYRLTDAVRSFARRHADRPAAVARHAAHFAERGRVHRADGGRTGELLDDLGGLVPELDAVIERAHDDEALVSAAFTVSLGRLFWSRKREVPAATERAALAVLSLARDVNSPEQAHRLAIACIWRSEAQLRLGDPAGALASAEAASEYAILSGKRHVIGTSHHAVSMHLQRLGDLAGAEMRLRAAIEFTDLPGHAAQFRANLTWTIKLQRGFDAALPWLDEAIAALPTNPPEPDCELQVRKSEAALCFDHPEHYPRALAALERAHTIAVQLADVRTAAFVRGQRGIVRCVMEGRPRDALPDLDAAIEEMTVQDDTYLQGQFRIERSVARIGVGDLDGAARDLTWVRQAAAEADRGVLVDFVEATLAILEGREPVLTAQLRDEAPDLVVLAEAASADRATAREHLRRYSPVSTLQARRTLDRVEAFVRERVDTWVADRAGRWLEDPEGQHHDFTSARRHPALVLALVRARLDRPGRGIGVDALMAAGWPGETVTERSASTRVRVALSALRKAGLRTLLLRGAEGWFLDPETPLRWSSGEQPQQGG
ncbi:MAG: hypothetical protein AAF211_12260 [Myxococcota bacterium]